MDILSKKKVLAKILGDRELAEYLITTQCVDDYAVAKLVEIFGERGIMSLMNFGKGYSRRYEVRLSWDPKSIMHLYTFLGKHGEYVIFPFSGYCGCYSRFPLNITRRYPCYHLISFSLDLATDSIICFNYEVEDIESLTVSVFYESFVKER